MGDQQLPPEIQELLDADKEQHAIKLEAFGTAIAKLRDEAVSFRANSGIEAEWTEAEESYQGIDDANRGTGTAMKPAAPTAGFSPSRPTLPTRSSVFLNITRPYVDSAAAKCGDILLPTDDRNWGYKPTIVPDLIGKLDDQTHVIDNGKPMFRPAGPQEAPSQNGTPIVPGHQPVGQVPLLVSDLAQEQLDIRDLAAKAAERRVEGWQIGCQFHAEERKVIEDCAKLGVGVLKGPFPVKRLAKAFKDGGLAIEETICPASRRIDPWNLFPDGACGEDIHNGGHIFERDFFTARQVRDLINLPGYLTDQIKKVLTEGPQKRFVDGGRNPADHAGEMSDKDRYQVWYFYGLVSAEDLMLSGSEIPEGQEDRDTFYALVTLINDTVVKAVLNPLDSGEFPYDVMPWQRRAGSWAGIGIAQQVNTPQRMINAATRNMMDNAGRSAAPQIVMRRNIVKPADGNWEITPGKIWYADEDADIRTVADAFTAIEIPSMQSELMNIIKFGLEMAEDVTGMPMIMQGQSSQENPDTVGGMQMLFNNASTVLRRIAKTFDDNITEPHMKRYYEWLLMYGPDDKEKLDFFVDARGSGVLVERDIQNQAILQMGQMVENPSFGMNPQLWFAEVCRAWHLDPKRFQYTPAQLAQMARQPQPVVPTVQAAQIRAQAVIQKEQIAAQTQLQVEDHRRQGDIDYAQAESQMVQITAQNTLDQLQMKREMLILEYSLKNNMQLNDVKADLAKSAMQNQTQQQLASAAAAERQAENRHDRTHDMNKHLLDLASGREKGVVNPGPPSAA